MSVNVMSAVFAAVVTPAAKKLTLLALADYADDQGGSIYPSLRTLAQKVGVSRSQAQRYVRAFIDERLLTVVANKDGGRHGDVPVYRMNVAQLRALPQWRDAPVEATGSTDATRSTDAQDGSHRCTGRVAPMHKTGSTHATQSINEPSVEPSMSHQRAPELRSTAPAGVAPKAGRPQERTLTDWQADRVLRGHKPSPSADELQAMAEQHEATVEVIAVAWHHFAGTNGCMREGPEGPPLRRDWIGYFRQAYLPQQLHRLWRARGGWTKTVGFGALASYHADQRKEEVPA